MRSLLLLLCLLAATCLALPAHKNLAGPPEDFASFALPDPIAATSSSSMAARHTFTLTSSPAAADSVSWSQKVAVDSPELLTLTIISPVAANVSLSAVPPSGQAVPLGAPQVDHYGIDGASFPSYTWALPSPELGTWSLTLTADVVSLAALPKTSAQEPHGLVIVGNMSPVKGWSALRSLSVTQGQPIVVEALAYDVDAQALTADGRSIASRRPTALPGASLSVELDVGEPDGRTVRVQMRDDGVGVDAAAHDGLYTAAVEADEAGMYEVTVVLQGQDARAQPLQRTVQHVVYVTADTVACTSDTAVAAFADDVLTMRVPVHPERAGGSLAGRYKVWAEVWGAPRDGGEAQVPIAWVGGILPVDRASDGVSDGQLNLQLNSAWLARAGASPSGPWTLRNLRLQDVDSSVVEEHVSAIEVRLAAGHALRAPLRPWDPSRDQPTWEMLWGKAPAHMEPRMRAAWASNGTATQEACSSGRLVLVHGYCAGSNPWPQSDFSNYAVFNGGLGKNWSHDQFARAIAEWEEEQPWQCFSAVGHSQGGPALTHLLTFYYSNLDLTVPLDGATIQSVGSPYGGCTLAGGLAELGGIFGVGCGSNYDLSTAGSGLWLAGIPSWARDNVYYYTTQYSKSGLIKYCNLAVNLVANWPNDGTAESDFSSLDGANFMGHKSSWCHTTDMKSPPQCTDGSRNNVLNKESVY